MIGAGFIPEVIGTSDRDYLDGRTEPEWGEDV